MKVTGIAICPPRTAESNPKATPELLASCFARYSRSNRGIETILGSVNWEDPEKSVDAIFKFVDYGHASIGGLTGGIALAIDDCSMWLAYKLFEYAQMADGQESSTRYIRLDTSSLPTPAEIGIPQSLEKEWSAYMEQAFSVYHALYEELDQKAMANPELVRVPAGAPEKVITRLRKNYALDRARYFIPMATKTNVGLVMSARMWADTIRRIDSLPLVEAKRCADLLRLELEKFAPRLTRHSFHDEASSAQMMQELNWTTAQCAKSGVSPEQAPDQVFISVDQAFPQFFDPLQSIGSAFEGKKNRYSTVGERIKRTMVRCTWNNIALAEMRDLNRHRTGFRLSLFNPVGFYLPNEIDRSRYSELLEKQRSLTARLAESGAGLQFYGFLLGVQTPFEHSTHLDKFIYEIELRTGLGAHYRYAEHLAVAAHELIKQMPELKEFVEIGTAEPE